MQGTSAEFVAAKLAEREERHRRAGQSRYLVEPNVKDGKGGLRDLHTLYWIAKYVYRVREREQLIEHGVYDPREYRRFRRCGDFLWAVRCHMHFLAGRAEERLSFDIQREIAVRLGYTEHPGLRDVERFMKHYFLIAKDVGDLTAILCAKLEDSQAKAMPVLSRMMARFRPRTRPTLIETDDFVVDYNRINVADETGLHGATRSISSACSTSRRNTIWRCIPTPCTWRRARSSWSIRSCARTRRQTGCSSRS